MQRGRHCVRWKQESNGRSVAEPRTFLIADDHPMVRDALSVRARARPSPAPRRAWPAVMAQVRAALERQPETDALLLDLDMPGMDGLTGLALLRSGHPTVPIIVVSAARDAGIVRRALRPRRLGLYRQVGLARGDRRHRARGARRRDLGAAGRPRPPISFAQRAAQLTPQQWRVLALMVQGDQNKQIAYKLGVGEATVKAHVTVILRKLGVRSRTQAVIEARGLALAAGVDAARRSRSSARSAAGFTGLCSDSTWRARRPQPQRRIAVGGHQRRRHGAAPGARAAPRRLPARRDRRRDAGRPAPGRAAGRRAPRAAAPRPATPRSPRDSPSRRAASPSPRARAPRCRCRARSCRPRPTAWAAARAGTTVAATTGRHARHDDRRRSSLAPAPRRCRTGRSSMRAMRSTMARPRPSPAPRAARSSSACRRTNSSKMTACLSAAMPGPLSLTSMRNASPSRRQPSSTRAGRPSALP